MGKSCPGGKILKTMRSLIARKTAVVLLAILGLIAIAALASGLRDVAFRAGQVMGEAEARTVSIPVEEILQNISGIPLWKQLLAWAIVFLIVIIVSMVLSPSLRWRLIKIFLRFTLITAAIYFLARRFPEIFRALNIFGDRPQTQAPLDPESILPPPVFEPPQMTTASFYLVGLAVALVLVVLVWALRRWWLRRQAALEAHRPIEELADIARDSLQKLSAGSAWDDVIVESYMRMHDVVERRKGLIRQHSITPSEFAHTLERAGVPGEAVHTLTHLFESVRYGDRRSSTDEINQAVSCLTTILRYCGEPA